MKPIGVHSGGLRHPHGSTPLQNGGVSRQCELSLSIRSPWAGKGVKVGAVMHNSLLRMRLQFCEFQSMSR